MAIDNSKAAISDLVRALMDTYNVNGPDALIDALATTAPDPRNPQILREAGQKMKSWGLSKPAAIVLAAARGR
jgi:hypothetical protein